MIYLDYCSTTPMSYEALDVYTKTAKEYIGNINSFHKIGEKSNILYKNIIKNIADMFNVMESELTFTSGAVEANNLSLIGTALANEKKGKHIIVSKVEHHSVYKICDYLETLGFEISYVNNDDEGLIDFDHLKKLVRSDTILVSVCALNNEIGIRQPLKMIRQIIKKENPNTIFHSDIAQAVGKISINLHDIDMASISSHKLFGPKGIGLLYHSERVKVSPLMFGGKINELVPTTYSIALIASFEKALNLSNNELDKKDHFVTRLNEKICNDLGKYSGVTINKTKYSIPHIISISLQNIDHLQFEKMLSEADIFIKANHNDINAGVLAVFKDVERSRKTLRISLSYRTTTEEINKFLEEFKRIYRNLYMGDNS